jgi:N-acetylneuraminic acid mutarotase
MAAMSSDDIEVHNSSVPVFDLERRSWATKTTFGDIPSARCHHVTLVYGDTLMLHGGYPILSNRRKELSAEEMATMQHALYDVYELHTVTLRWRRIHTTPSPSLWGHSAILYNKDVIVFGGVDVVENAETNSIAVWNQVKQRWMWVDYQNLDLRCAMHTAAQDGSRMFVFGGVSFRTKSQLRTLHEFNLDFGNWRELHPQGKAPHPRSIVQRLNSIMSKMVKDVAEPTADK